MDRELRESLELLGTERVLRRLANEYSHGIDLRDISRFMAIWHDDAVYELDDPTGGAFVGKESIRRLIEEVVWPSLIWSFHSNSTFQVEIEGHRAVAVSNGLYFGIPVEPDSKITTGTRFGKY
jgi:hypothetical protein